MTQAPAAIAVLMEISAEVDLRPCYALAYNRKPPVATVSVRNIAGGLTGPLTISISSSWTASDIPPVKPATFEIECPEPGHEYIKDTSSTRLSDEALATLDEAAPAIVTINVTDATGHSESIDVEITVLARNQWRNELQELSVAFVQAQHPDIPEIINDAAARLGRVTGSASMEGYQSEEPKRVRAMAEAIFMTLRERVNIYIESAEDFEEEGQRVRPLDEVLATRQGNCIELACLYAACVQYVKLDPVLFLVHGHAFGGVYLNQDNGENRWNHPRTTEFASIINLVDRGEVLPIETTSIPMSSSFEDAVALAKPHISERKERCARCASLMAAEAPAGVRTHVSSAVDVVAARRQGVKVLPTRRIENGVVTIYVDNGLGKDPVVERRDAQTHRLLPETVPARVQQWKNALLDLSRRNPLISFNAENSGVLVVPPSGVLGDIEDHLVEGKRIELHGAEHINQVLQAAGIRAVQNIGEDDRLTFWRSSNILFGITARGTVEARVRKMISTANLEEQETGSNNLHLALGSLQWPFEGQRNNVHVNVTSPIFLVPIRITLKRGQRIPTITMDPGSMTTVNYSLLHLLRTRFNMKLSWFGEDMRDDSGLNIIEGLTALRAELMESGLADKGLRVDDTASIGLFRFNKTRLWKDLDENWKQFAENPVVKHLIQGSAGAFSDPADPEGEGTPDYDDTTLLNPQLADGAQTRAIVKAISGQSFVLEGPPGTGKSQTITNLLANALASGKKVLFVAEKQAALSVVKERLQASGLNPFIVDLFDSKTKPEELKVQLRDALDFQPDADMQRWETNEANFTNAARALALYRDRLHGNTPAGRSFYEAYQSLLAMGDGPVAEIGRALASVPRDQISELTTMLRNLPEITTAAQPGPNNAWSMAYARSFDTLDRAAIAAEIRTIAQTLPALPAATSPWGAALQACTAVADLQALTAAMTLDAAGRLPTSRDLRPASRTEWLERAVAAVDETTEALSAATRMDPALGPTTLATDINPQLAAVTEASTSFAVGRKGRMRSALGGLAAVPVFTNADPATIVARLRALAEHSYHYRNGLYLLTQIEGLSHIPGAPGAQDLTALRTRIGHLHLIAARIARGGAFSDALVAAMDGHQAASDGDSLLRLNDALTSLWALLEATESTSELWVGKRGLMAAITESLPAWEKATDGLAFTTLKRWIDLLNHIAPLEQEPFHAFRGQIVAGTIAGDQALHAFERALLQAVLTVVGEENNFDVFDHLSHNRLVSRFVELLRERQELLRTVIPHMLHGARTFNAVTTTGTVGQLRTELNAKRRGARSIRDLLTKYPDLISELTPCFLMSPDSVAKYVVPGTIHFDVVVFDEASQVPVADAIGAMGRARSVVVVGDSKQMPPTSFFAAASAVDEDEADVPVGDTSVIPADEESILDECVESGMPREMLTWHYRSRDEVLISFSNEQYYEGRLATFPTALPNRPDCGLVYHRVNGQFMHGTSTGASKDPEGRANAPDKTNPIEADAIVAEVVRRIKDPVLSQFSMGVVTLNKPQTDLISSKLDEITDPQVVEYLQDENPDTKLFVLNLENVQGRERDVIILGTAFSNRAGTDTMPLNFGPLNNKGGERRLNVAVTRARRQVVIFSSFDPGQLARATAEGLKGLHAYLLKAQSVAARAAESTADDSPTDPYVAAVAEGLRARGLVVKTQLGLSSFKVDLAVTTPEYADRWLVGVLLDGPRWARRDLALDRDAVPTTVLHGLMDWPAISRVWLPAWRRDPAEVLDEIASLAHLTVEQIESGATDAAVAAPATTAEPTHALRDGLLPEHLADAAIAPGDATAPLPESLAIPTPRPSADTGESTSVEQPYRAWEATTILGTPEQLEYSGPTITRLLVEIADVEGPIPVDAAIRKAARCFGLERVRENRVQALLPYVPRQNLVKTEFGDFLFPRGYTDGAGNVTSGFTWFRRTTAAERKINSVAPHEIANAMAKIARDSHGISRDELAAAVLTVFGYTRKTHDTLAFVERAIDWALRERQLTARDGAITPS